MLLLVLRSALKKNAFLEKEKKVNEIINCVILK